MHTFFVIYSDERVPDNLTPNLDESGDVDTLDLLLGKPLAGGAHLFTGHTSIGCRKFSTYDFVRTVQGAWVVSPRAADLLRTRFGTSAQLFPLSITCADGELRGWSVLNVVALVEVIDLAKSQPRYLRTTPPLLGGFDRVVLRPEAGEYEQLGIMRDKAKVTLVIVSECFVEEYRSASLKGLQFKCLDGMAM